MGDIPFLPLKEEFHPRRNQARQKLGTLSETKFKDLATDVYFEISRRVLREKKNGRASEKEIMNELREGVQESKRIDKEHKIEDLNAAGMKKSVSAVAERKESPKLMKKSASESKQDRAADLNFDSLDNLMADLGEMMETHLDTATPLSEKKKTAASTGLNIQDLMNEAQNEVEKAKKKTNRSQSMDKLAAVMNASLTPKNNSADSLKASADSFKESHREVSESRELFASYVTLEKDHLAQLKVLHPHSYSVEDFSEYAKQFIKDLSDDFQNTNTTEESFKSQISLVLEGFLKEILKFAANSKKHKSYSTKMVHSPLISRLKVLKIYPRQQKM